MKIEVLDLARAEFDDAFVHYESARTGLGEVFREALKQQIEKIKLHPDAWTLIRPGIRKCQGGQFPYDVIYHHQPGRILIIALAHQKRRPHYWNGRV